MRHSFKSPLSVIGPGILIAATGVGAGDLATAALTGMKLGTAVLWAVLLGALFKLVLNEGLTRWQLATGETLLEGALGRLGRPARYAFLLYFLAWSFMVAAALMSACGVAAQAMFPLSTQASTGKVIYGLIHSLLGVLLVRWGGFRFFEKIMGACIAFMFVTVVTTAILLRPDWSDMLRGLVVPTVPRLNAGGLAWVIALMGGVGGTVTVLCYGYWIREEGRFTPESLAVCRIDLTVGYVMTGLFGLSMVVIGSTVHVDGSGATLILRLSERLGDELGILGRWVFLMGAWGAIFSSLLGVWQSVPYLFSDLWMIIRGERPSATTRIDVASPVYRRFLYALAVVPAIGLWIGFARMQKLYALVGAMFIPILALTLLLLNGRSEWIGSRYRNGPLASTLLALILLFFVAAGWLTVRRLFV